ncbi:response regulator [Epibacterium sp. SM1979]|uniref:histidine kinase n=1 Tax=Tritonibacter litoralis TaxID=2662264 RepID=A0A843Y8I8_9RHOB|nr:ATP-binding protein [Tritonibacter litoralis]MQQ07331.1 response regulator [Tritonibacter litoralis]
MYSQQERKLRRFRRGVAAFGIVILLLLFGESIWLGSKILTRLQELSTAQTDNLRWNLTQIEVEYLKVENRALATQQEEDLRDLRRAFDVFYSRITTVRESSVFVPLRADKTANELLMHVQERLDELAAFVDSSDAEFLQKMDAFRAQVFENREDIRALAIAGLNVYSEENKQKRLDLHRLLSQLASVVFVLVSALGLTALLLAVLYRRVRSLAAARARSAARMKAMVSSSLDAILVMNSQGQIVEYNGAAQTVFGYKRDEALGSDMAQLIVPTHHRDAHRKGLARFLKTGKSTVATNGRIELEGMRKSGEVFPVELSITPTVTDDDTVFVSYLRDISDRYAAEAELRAARDDALAGERAKANLLTVMSHEMRTPLTGVLGAIEIMESEQPTATQRKYLRAMRVSGELLLQHVNDVLELSRLEADVAPEEETSFDLVDLVEGLVASQQATAQTTGNDLSVYCNLGGSRFVKGMPRAIQQTLLNLVGNALKFTRNGAVMVEISRDHDGDMVEFQVADTGKGIAPEHLERIFEDFVTLDSSYGRMSEGTGLGLAITRRMVAAMGGEITCESEVGEGSTFIIRTPLPVVDNSTSGVMSRSEVDRRSARLLVVEDNDVNRELLQKMLELMGHNVTAASGGAEAVALVAKNHFDLILMDISMPEVDGIEAIRRIRARNLAPQTDVVALTAHAASKDHARILAAGFAEILTKPVNKRQLVEVIGRRALRPGTGESEEELGSDIAQFFEALGAEKAQEFLIRFLDEIALFAAELSKGGDISRELRTESHRLAGSAAVLGLASLRRCLQEIEIGAEDRPPACDQFGEVWQESEGILTSELRQIAAE